MPTGCAVAALLLSGSACALARTAAEPGRVVQLDPVEGQTQPPAVTAYHAASGPVQGFTATESTAGTKTGTPIAKVPAAVSVVGAQQIQDTSAESVPEALRYTPGVRADSFGFAVTAQDLLDRTFVASCNTVDSCFYGDRRRVTGPLTSTW